MMLKLKNGIVPVVLDKDAHDKLKTYNTNEHEILEALKTMTEEIEEFPIGEEILIFEDDYGILVKKEDYQLVVVNLMDVI